MERFNNIDLLKKHLQDSYAADGSVISRVLFCTNRNIVGKTSKGSEIPA